MNYLDKKWRLCACRIDAGYKQKEVAEIVGVTEATIISWETGKTSPKMEHSQKLSELYRIPLAYMDFSKEGNKVPTKDRVEE